MKIAVIGLGKLGLPIACTLAEKAEVIGCDCDPGLIDALRAGQVTTTEPGVTPAAVAKIKHLSTDVTAAIELSDFSFVIVPTPSDNNGRFTNAYLLDACLKIGAGLSRNRHHTVVIVSTVMPGTIDSAIHVTLERASGLKAGEDFGLLYSPQMVALGSVIEDFCHPDLIIIGKYGTSRVEDLLAVYDRVMKSLPQIAVTTPINAELAKLSLNCAISSKLLFFNQLARVVEHIPGANVDVITEIIGADRRIGRGYTRAGIMVGGPCFPRDLQALATLPGAVWFNRQSHHNNDSINALIGTIRATRGVVGILGMSYKVGTDVRICAVGSILSEFLLASDRTVVEESADKACDQVVEASDVVVVTLPDEIYRGIPLETWTSKPRVVIDCWRILRHLEGAPEHLVYIPIGVGPRP